MTDSCKNCIEQPIGPIICKAMAPTLKSGWKASTEYSELSVDNSPSLLENRSAQENRAVSHFINAMLPPNFTLCIGVIPSHTMAKEFFDAIKARCCPGNHFQKLKVMRDLVNMLVDNGSGQPRTKSVVILSIRKTFAMFKKLGVEADKLEGLLAQAACHAPLPSIRWLSINS
ncbi:hypothetical protein O181_019561 [Austropuccinia psidii MF-1]|uniref:Uncharacterized protein n=1 Tax=Austropuccinia psidii MF-1 TaxID=1389203 RepID=A0A9Q3GTZ4_9BASI|nr:hypothetical protein [Austropuccinia psidii MF-1]